MRSTELIDVLKDQVSREVTETVIEKLHSKIDDILSERKIVNSQFLTIEQACEYLSVGRSTFYNLVKEHKPLRIYLGSSPRYSKADLDKMYRFD